MTPAEAQAHLRHPLKFGDPEQIQALTVMELVECAIKALLSCPHVYLRRTELCECLEEFPADVLLAAMEYDETFPKVSDWGEEITECLRLRDLPRQNTARSTVPSTKS